METKATLTANKKIARQSLEASGKNDFSKFEKLIDTKKYKSHYPGQEKALDYEATVQLNKEYNVAFPDAKLTVEAQIAEGDLVLSRVTYNGIHKGELLGTPATGKKVKLSGMTLQKIVKGKIVEEWNEFDSLGMLQKIGAIPELETAEY